MNLSITENELNIIKTIKFSNPQLYSELWSYKVNNLKEKKTMNSLKKTNNMVIKVKYHLKEFPNSTLFKFFKTQEQVEIFKSQNTYYIFE